MLSRYSARQLSSANRAVRFKLSALRSDRTLKKSKKKDRLFKYITLYYIRKYFINQDKHFSYFKRRKADVFILSERVRSGEKKSDFKEHL